MEVGNQCDFSKAGEFDFGGGAPAENHGGGIVTQLMWGGSCPQIQHLILLNCNKKRVVVFNGRPKPITLPGREEPVYPSYANETVEHALEKNGGPISFSSKTKLDEVIEAGKPLRLYVRYDGPRGYLIKFDDDQRDPFCGCDLFDYSDERSTEGD